MKAGLFILMFLGIASQAVADPEADRVAFEKFYKERLPGIEIAAHKDGAYALDAAKREQWLEIEDFPPYEIAVDEGESLFSVAFANGKSYTDCFANGGMGIKQTYPYFDLDRGEVITLELAINNCRDANDEAQLDYMGEEMGNISAYMAFTSRGNKFDIKVPEEAVEAYEQGKRFYYERRGQLDFACSSCHMDIVGGLLRAEILSASIGHATHWPTYRFKWEQIGGIQRRFLQCNEQVGAESLAQQSKAYRNLEYFLTYMNNGMELNGPASRR
ncbi:MAG: sulfur oxidation c-type cytochrome SoxA [Gammaproteobacteria bacterium]|jgi:sulfur-oxidizing protein SoxA|nr:sulfur oxidation c-type cytochrome SoxA [Gammaproteobacteria bacterium]